MKWFVTLAISEATGVATEGLNKYLLTVSGKHSIYFLHKAAVLGTLHIIRKVLQSEN
jgi:hypothetical protein